MYVTPYLGYGYSAAADAGINRQFGFRLCRIIRYVNDWWVDWGNADLVDGRQCNIHCCEARCHRGLLGHLYKYHRVFSDDLHDSDGATNAHSYQHPNGYIGALRRHYGD